MVLKNTPINYTYPVFYPSFADKNKGAGRRHWIGSL